MWLAVKTRSRHEALAARSLQARGWQTFLPLCPTRRRWSDRVKLIDLPLFPGYFFLQTHAASLRPVLETPGVCSVVSFDGRPAPIPASEIEALQRLLASGLPPQPHAALHPGDPVRINAGPLAGVHGQLVRAHGHFRLVVSISLLQRAVSVEIDGDLVEPLPSSRQPRLSSPPEFLMVAS